MVMAQDSQHHLTLYQKYRPRKWSDMVGQEKIISSLRASILKNRVPNALIFAGERGTGKTTAALLLAKSVNCENLGDDAEPCNECDTCLAIDGNRQIGVNYISMANKGSAADVREIAQEARLRQPLNRQVWILDETHNLSQQAFDALLIPMEDTDMSALFIFCSTEIEKIPATITSRIGSRRFREVNADVMSEFLRSIGDKEGIELDEETIESAVRMGRGSVRDSLTSLETILETGSSESPFGNRVLEAMAKRSLSDVLAVLAEGSVAGVSFRDMAEQLFEDLRDLLLVANGVEGDLIAIPAAYRDKAVIRGLGGQKGIMLYMNSIGEALTMMSGGSDSRIMLEIALLKSVTAINKAVAASGSSSTK